MQKTCATCGDSYTISPGEQTLHAKIMQSFETGAFPLAQLCHDCRLQRKMVWRNERHLYRRTCDACRTDMLSVYPAGAQFPVYERSCWWGDGWDALEYGRDYDFSTPFFDQFAALLGKVPRQALNISNSENCDYCNFAFDSRNSYLSQCLYNSESLLYCYWLLDCKDCIDCSYCFQTQRCVDCTDCNHAYNCYACNLSHNCRDCAFLYDCRGCSDCIGCVGLRRKSYCIFNEQLTKGEYLRRKKELDIENAHHVRLVEDQLKAMRAKHPHLYSIQDKTEDCTGDYLFESKDCVNCFQLYRSQDCINVQDAESRDALDCYHPGWSELTYETYSSVTARACAFTIQCWTGDDMFYSDNCHSCSHCFGCISLRHKKYCILNTQYSENEYLALLPKIRAHMESTGEWGLFFPETLSPFPYNESMAHQDYPLTPKEVRKRGWRWEEETPSTTGKETVGWDAVPTRTADVQDAITKEILSCTRCRKNYKIIPQELAFCREASLPLPRLCPDCRFRARLALRNPRKLWDRSCAKCDANIQTTYAPDRPEIIYCEKCYVEAMN